MPNFVAELKFHKKGLTLVAGLDEVGRGAWAGPLLAGAVILPAPSSPLRRCLASVDDCKLLTPQAREACAVIIREQAIAWAVGSVAVEDLDEWGLTRATRVAMSRALDALSISPQALLIDAFPLPDSPLPQRAIIRGDSYSFSIAAASIVAKTARDAIMRDLARAYSAYGFEDNKGYGTDAHQDALDYFGVSTVHRRSWAPIRERLALEAAPRATPSHPLIPAT